MSEYLVSSIFISLEVAYCTIPRNINSIKNINPAEKHADLLAGYENHVGRLSIFSPVGVGR